MTIENVLKYDGQECSLDENSPALTAQKRAGTDCIVIKIPPPEIIAQWDVNDDDRELNRIIRDLRWTGMITDALIVLAITAVFYLSPAVETLRAVMERTAIASPSHHEPTKTKAALSDPTHLEAKRFLPVFEMTEGDEIN